MDMKFIRNDAWLKSFFAICENHTSESSGDYTEAVEFTSLPLPPNLYIFEAENQDVFLSVCDKCRAVIFKADGIKVKGTGRSMG